MGSGEAAVDVMKEVFQRMTAMNAERVKLQRCVCQGQLRRVKCFEVVD